MHVVFAEMSIDRSNELYIWCRISFSVILSNYVYQAKTLNHKQGNQDELILMLIFYMYIH